VRRVSVAVAGPGTAPAAGAIDRRAEETIAAACILVFSRIHPPGQIGVRVDDRTLWTTVDPDTTVGQLASTLAADPAEPEHGLLLDLWIRDASEAAPKGAAEAGSLGATLSLGFEAGSEGLTLHLDYRIERIAEVSAQDLLEKIALAIDSLSRRPDARIAELDLVTAVARRVMPDAARPIAARDFILTHEVLLATAQRHADEPAIRYGKLEYSYGELRSLSLRVAERLSDAGLGVGDLVTVSGRSSFGLIASAIAVLAAGGVLVAIDDALPDERREQIAALTQTPYRIVVAAGESLTAPGSTISVSAWPSHAEIEAIGDSEWHGPILPQDAAAYIFFTSGSTGAPKGVVGAHRGLAHFLEWQRQNFPIGPGDRSAQLTALSFDVVLRDIFFPLTSGATICIPERELILDARRVLAWFREQRLTILHCVPSLMKAWLQGDDGSHSFRSLRYIFFAGEPLTHDLLLKFRAAASPETRITNLYGPTETTLAKLANPVDEPEPGIQPVGKPQPGVDVFILRDRRTFCGLWETGEIVIRTPYRSRGYFRNEELTRQVFLQNPRTADPDDLMYCTGDLGRYRPDGKVEIFGRIDSQIKIRGVRIEPNEIESRMHRFPRVRDAAVFLRQGAGEEKILCGVVVREAGADGETDADLAQRIRAFLRDALHEAMVPALIVFVDKLPYLPNGKLNRKELANLRVEEAEGAAQAAPLVAANDAARPMFDALRKLLPVPIAALEPSFVELGGDSLSFISATLAIERILGYVPEGWERRPLTELVNAARTAPGQRAASLVSAASGGAPARPGNSAHAFFAAVEIPILIRALAIVLIVISHADAAAAVNATSALFVVSGISFGRFLLPGIESTGDLRPTLRFILKFGIPAGLWLLLTRALTFKRIWVPDLFLAGTLFQDPESPHFTLWYLDILAATVLILAALAKSRRALRTRHADGIPTGRSESFGWALSLVLLGLVASGAQISFGIWDGVVGVDSVGPFRWLWMVALGALIVETTSKTRKVVVLCLLIAIAALAHWTEFLTTEIGDFFYASVMVLIFLKRVLVPRILLRPVIVIASSTLFVYIVNYTVIHQMENHGVAGWLPLKVVAALLAGIALTRVWDWIGSAIRFPWRPMRLAPAGPG
jgi:amino acid adenylation domain-containing protein